MQQRKWDRDIAPHAVGKVPPAAGGKVPASTWGPLHASLYSSRMWPSCEAAQKCASELDSATKTTNYNLKKIIVSCFYSLILLLNLTSCSKDHTYINAPNPDPNSSYQTGPTWNREKLILTTNLPFQILNMNRAYKGDVGVGVYLGEFKGKHIGMTAAHLYPDLTSCKDEVSFLIQDQEQFHYYPCDGWSFTLKDNDIMFFEISIQSADINLLSPVNVSKNPTSINQQLKLITFERNFEDQTVELYSDSSTECKTLSNEAKQIADPDISDDRMITSWSMAMGCDSRHGDSGAPVYNEVQQLVGLLWTGKYPKNQSSQSFSSLTETQLWEDYNYFVPVEKIKEELGKLMVSSQVKTSDQNTLSQIFNSF